jgi:hypothetical protein
MFKVLISIVVLTLLIIAIVMVAQIIIGVQKSKSLPDDNLPIDDIIEELEFKLMRVELQAERGVKEAEEKVTLFKSELEKARVIKTKLNKSK